MKIKKIMSMGVAITLTLTALLTGCGATGEAGEDNTTGTENATEAASTGEESTEEKDKAPAGDNELVDSLKKKYSAADKNEYDGNVIKVNRDEAITFELGYNPWDMDASIYDSFVLYQDADLKYPVEAGNYDYDFETGMLTITPPFYGILEMESSEIDLSHLSGNYLEDDEYGWGTLSQYYLAVNVDLQTGKELSAPVITMIRVNAEISTAPQLTFDQTEEGYARFTWKEVPGAEGYLLFVVNKDDSGIWQFGKVFADVKGTEWNSGSEAHEFEGEILSLNYRFRQFYTSEDSQTWMEETDSIFLDDDDVAYDEYFSEYFGMIAYNSQGCSPASNLLSAKDLSHMLPAEIAYHSNEETYFGIQGTLALPATMGVTMCDGSLSQKVIDYDFDSIEKDEENGRFRIAGYSIQTPFQDVYTVYNPSWDDLDTELAAVKARQDELKNKGGHVAPQVSVEDNAQPKEEKETPKDESKEEDTKTEEPKTEDSKSESEKPKGAISIDITANSALSEFIAISMLDTKEVIDVSAFPEAADTEQIIDAFFEAQYQNPLILGIQGGSIDPDNRVLYVDYDFDRDRTAQRQQRIQERVDEIVGEIIDDGMTELEKELAINTWLCENATYDNAALENAEKYSFTQVDEDFYDSFTAYGILSDGVGVCASYSAAFKLLADAAGVESIVVTGYLDGSVPHAWNKVKLDDEWYIVDATNNDNDVIENALLNLSDYAAYGTLVENDSFAMNSSLSQYMASEDVLEYYHTVDKFYEVDEISDQLADLLLSDGKAVLRTDYSIDDEMFYGIAQQAADKSSKNISGFYWMGVIRLEE